MLSLNDFTGRVCENEWAREQLLNGHVVREGSVVVPPLQETRQPALVR